MNAIRAATTRAAVLAPIACVQIRAASQTVPPVKKVSAVKTSVKAEKTVAKKAAVKVAEKNAVIARKKAAAREEKHKLADTKSDMADKKKAIADKKKAIADKKKAIKATGAVSPFTLFVSKSTAGTKGRTNMKDVAAKWKAMPAGEKAEYQEEAKKNLAARQEVKASFKRPASKYALFTKEHFPAAYAAALKKTTDKKEAFKLATKEVSTKYKASK